MIFNNRVNTLVIYLTIVIILVLSKPELKKMVIKALAQPGKTPVHFVIINR